MARQPKQTLWHGGQETTHIANIKKIEMALTVVGCLPEKEASYIQTDTAKGSKTGGKLAC